MDPHVHEWLHLTLRWIHILAGIMWIGDSFLFMWLDRTLLAPDPPRNGVTGELFLVHGGGYYRVERRLFQPGRMPSVLHWFKWESLSTWATGFLLLLLVYYYGGGILLVDPSVSKISVPFAMALGLALLPASWFLYDALWTSPLGKSTPFASVVSIGLFSVLAYFVTHVFGSRASYLEAGAILGTLMTLNVWVRILPMQRRMLATLRAGQNVDPASGLAAKQRSTHNTYMTLPVVFAMASNHFPTTYGSRWNWVVLVLLALAGGGIRHFMITRSTKTAWLLAAGGALTAAAFVLTR